MDKTYRYKCSYLYLLVTLSSLLVLSLNSAVFGFEFKGFSDVTFSFANNTQDNNNSTFALGQLDMYLSQNLSDRVDVLGELVVEANEEGEFGVDLERLQVSYIFNDSLRVLAGRFHNLLGYWNMAYHHGAQIQTTIERPQFLKFEDDGGILPVHVVGMWIDGILRTEPAQLEYGIMVGNGAKIVGVDLATSSGGTLDPNSSSDNSKNKAVSLRLRAMPSAIDGLGIGISVNFSDVQLFGTDDKLILVNSKEEISQLIFGADFEYLANNIELLSEFYQIRDKAKESFSSNAWYMQGGYKIAGRFTPYVRFERVTVDENDPYFIALGQSDSKKTITGMRYDIMLTSSLKIEARFINSIDNFQEYGIQWAFAF